jgi:hypothetical protein
MLVQITVITSTNFAGRLLNGMLKKSGEDGKGLGKKVGTGIAERQHSVVSIQPRNIFVDLREFIIGRPTKSSNSRLLLQGTLLADG